MEQAPLLKVNNIEVIYEHVILVLKGVSLEVDTGGIVSLLGANGAGKTTTLKAISNLVKAADFVRAFRNIGCKFSIDDFGTGLASHNYLRELPVDYVKIDGIFVTDIDKNRNDYAMARSINDLAHFLGQQTIAESVENDVIIEKLREIGVDYLQGWGIARPKVLSEITAGLSNLET